MNWKKEFDNKFGIVYSKENNAYTTIPEDIKQFIQNLLDKQKEEILLLWFRVI